VNECIHIAVNKIRGLIYNRVDRSVLCLVHCSCVCLYTSTEDRMITAMRRMMVVAMAIFVVTAAAANHSSGQFAFSAVFVG